MLDKLISEHKKDALSPVTVIVPTTYAGLSLRRQLAGKGGLINVRFIVLPRLAEHLGAASMASHGKSPLTPLIKLAALRSFAGKMSGQPPLGPVALHPRLHLHLRNTFDDMEPISEDGLTRLEASNAITAQAIAWYRKYRQKLKVYYTREEQCLAAALSVREGRAAGALRDLGFVIFYCLPKYTRAERALVQALWQEDACEVVLPLTGEDAADAPVLLEKQRLEKLRVTPVMRPPRGGTPAQARHLLTAPDAAEEVRWVVRSIMKEASQGRPFHRIAVLYRNADPYAPVIEAALTHAKIPQAGQASIPLHDTPAGKLLTGLLDLLDSDFDRARFMHWVAEAPVRVHDEYPASWELARWEVISQEAGIVRGRSSWAERLARYGSAKEEELRKMRETEDEDDGSGPALTRGAESLIASARRLASFMEEVATQAPPPDGSPWSKFAEWAKNSLNRFAYLDDSWSENDHKALEQILGLLSDMHCLDRLEDGTTLAAFRQMLDDSLSAASGKAGKFGTGVFTAAPGQAQCMDFDSVYIVGMAEGAFPPSGQDDAVLPDSVRSLLDGEEGLPLRRERRLEERRLFLEALDCAPVSCISYPRAAASGGRRQYPSPWFTAAASALHGSPLTTAGLEKLAGTAWLTALESPQQGLRLARELAFADGQDYRLASLQRWHSAGRPAASHFLNADGTRGRRVLDMESARNSGNFTPWDGNLAGLADTSPRFEVVDGTLFSATRLERWAACPFRYFMEDVLKLTVLRPPEDLLTMEARERGGLLHTVLERFIKLCMERGILPGHGEPWQAQHSRLLSQVAEEEFTVAESKGITGHALLWEAARDEMRHDLEAFLSEDSALRAAFGSRPAYVEYSFGTDGSPNPAPLLALPGGPGVRFRGKIDRVDFDASGQHAWVMDYKTGKSTPQSQLKKDIALGGKLLQLPAYALALRAGPGRDRRIEALYWYNTARGGFSRLSLPLEQAEARFTECVGTIVSGIGSGIFVANPGQGEGEDFSHCRFCDYRRACHAGRWVQWDAKAAAPELAPYLQMIAPMQGN